MDGRIGRAVLNEYSTLFSLGRGKILFSTLFTTNESGLSPMGFSVVENVVSGTKGAKSLVIGVLEISKNAGADAMAGNGAAALLLVNTVLPLASSHVHLIPLALN